MLWYWIYTHAFGDKYTKHFLIILGPPPEILTLSIYIAEFSMFFEMISATDATHVLLFVNLCYFLAFSGTMYCKVLYFFFTLRHQNF